MACPNEITGPNDFSDLIRSIKVWFQAVLRSFTTPIHYRRQHHVFLLAIDARRRGFSCADEVAMEGRRDTANGILTRGRGSTFSGRERRRAIRWLENSNTRLNAPLKVLMHMAAIEIVIAP
jgi:hypothetical protein